MQNIILVGPPRSGAGLLSALMGEAPRWGHSQLALNTVLDDLPGFRVADREYASHRLTAQDATAEAVAALAEAARTPVDPERSVEIGVDWNPRMSVRIGLLAEALPEAKFVLMTRLPVATMSSLMDAWRSQRFASVPDLPDWWGEPWSFPLTEGWRELIGAPPAQVCSSQWAAITGEVLDDLAALPDDRWTVASFEALLADPGAEMTAVAGNLGLEWAGEVPDPLPLTASAVTEPAPGKWRNNMSELAAVYDGVRPIIDRLHEAFTRRRPDLEWPEPEAPESPEEKVFTRASAGTPFSSSHTNSLVSLLTSARASLIITTYKSGHVIIARADANGLNTEFKRVERPMGVAVTGNRLAIGAAETILTYTSQPGLAARVPSDHEIDNVYAPRSVIFTGDVAIHDMGYGGDGQLYYINTKFSCLCRQDIDYSFVPVWRPEWITGLAPEDRCHLNGLAMVDGRPRYVTALSQTDTDNGWRELKGTSGVIVDIATNRVVTKGLSMPHSPRWYRDQLWVLESGKGTIATVDIHTGKVRTVATLPGFTRGLSFLGQYALVGMSQVRETVFSSLPITEQSAERNCGVWVVDTRSGDIVAFLKFDGVVQEIFDVQVLPATWPTMLDPGELTRGAYVLPDEALKEVAVRKPAG